MLRDEGRVFSAALFFNFCNFFQKNSKIYESAMQIIGNGIKDKLKHPFKSQDSLKNLTNYFIRPIAWQSPAAILNFCLRLGRVTELHCDYLILEEQPATADMVLQIKAAGKKVIVWTVDTDSALYQFLGSNVDGIITNRSGKSRRGAGYELME